MNAGTIVSLVSVGLGVLGSLVWLSFQMGRVSVRVESLERWREEFRQDISNRFSHLENLIRGVEV